MPAITGKKVRFTWSSNEKAKFFCAHENINDMKPCGEGFNGEWTEDDIPEGKHLFWVVGIDETGNRAEPLDHEWIVGKVWLLSVQFNKQIC